MPLLAVTSRLAHTASLISQTCGANTKPPGPFTHALLGDVPIIDIIRDADESERKLVRLEGEEVGRREVAVNGVGNAKVKRAVEADGSVNGMGQESVEVFAGAALELVEEYDSMPRAKQHILKLLERSSLLHESIAALQAEIASKQSGTKAPALPSQTNLEDLESSVRDIESNISAVRQKRDTLRVRVRELKHSGSPSKAPAQRTTPRVDESENPFLSNNALAQSIGLPSALSAAQAETSAISTSTAEGIVREESPLVTRSANVRRGILGLEEEEDVGDETIREGEEGDDSFDMKQPDEEAESLLDEMGEPDLGDDLPDDEPEDDDQDDATVVLQAKPAPPPVQEPEPPTEEAKEEEDTNITPAMGIVLNKIWSTSAGQVLDPTVQEGTSLSPEATLRLLNNLLVPPSPPHSPAQPSSISSLVPNPSSPTPDTVLLAKLLLMLVSSPSLMVPLNSLKDQLKKFASERGFADPGEKALRGVYGAVGRGVVKIDRGKGVVLFA